MLPRPFGRGTVTVAILCLFAAAACGSTGGGPPASAIGDDAITVGSFDFPESVLLGELYAQALEGAHLRVVRKLDLGTRELVEPALERGLLEVVPEYAGSALQFLGGAPDADPSITAELLKVAASTRHLTTLTASPAMDRNGFAMTAEKARSLGVVTLSDLRSHSADLVFGGPPECPQRPLCLKGLGSVYGLHFAAFIPLDAGGPLTALGLRGGTIDVGLLFTSDPSFSRDGFVLLGDDLGLEPAENVTPLVRDDTMARFGPAIANALGVVSSHLTTDALRRMNQSVAGGRPVAQVARAWLISQGLGGG